MKLDLREKVLNKYDDFLKDNLQDVVVNDSTSLEEHGDNGPKQGFGQYNLLAHLSTYFNNDVVADIGTGYQATSARALSYNETNTIYSYDTEYSESARQYINNLDNVIYNVFNPLKSLKGKDIILSASLISLDVDPHDGEQEREFYCFFVDNNWKGIMVCDDIRLVYQRPPGMAWFWESVDKPKYDLTTTVYSHNSGTGLICFDDQEVIF